MSKTSDWVIREQEKAALNPSNIDDHAYELDVAVAALQLIEIGCTPISIARGALAMIDPKGYPQWHTEAAVLGETLFKQDESEEPS